MENLIAAHEKIVYSGDLTNTIDHLSNITDLLATARDKIANGASPSMTLAKLKTPVKGGLERLNQDIKEAHSVITNYGKAVDKKFKNLSLPTASNDPFSSHPTLTNRAIAMHLLREGQFRVASTFIAEANARPPMTESVTSLGSKEDSDKDVVMEDGSWAQDFAAVEENDEADGEGTPGDLQRKFSEMYHILHALRNERNVDPAIAWARKHSEALELRGSNLEFELCRLRFVELYTGSGRSDAMDDGDSIKDGRLRALEYALATFKNLSSRYLQDITSLLGSLAYAPSIASSPYHNVFFNDEAWNDVASNFTREFCGMLGLSEKSPLYTAVTAGGIALPVLEKLERVMAESGGQWTSANELPVEIHLPPQYLFHSIFVCPVSKEQGTDANPPMMMPCGHVIAKESLEKISRGSKFKCPYCPTESHPRDARKVFL